MTTIGAAAVGPILVIVVRTDPAPSIIEHQKLWIAHLEKTPPAAPRSSPYCEATPHRPPKRRERVIKRVFRTFGEVVKAGAMVIEGTGFVAATFRSVLSMILLALRPNYPFKIFASIEDGLAFGLNHVDATDVTVSDTLSEVERTESLPTEPERWWLAASRPIGAGSYRWIAELSLQLGDRLPKAHAIRLGCVEMAEGAVEVALGKCATRGLNHPMAVTTARATKEDETTATGGLGSFRIALTSSRCRALGAPPSVNTNTRQRRRSGNSRNMLSS